MAANTELHKTFERTCFHYFRAPAFTFNAPSTFTWLLKRFCSQCPCAFGSCSRRAQLHSIAKPLICTHRWDTLWATRDSQKIAGKSAQRQVGTCVLPTLLSAICKQRVRLVTDSLRGFLQYWSASSHPKLSGTDWKRLWDWVAETVSTQGYLCRSK